MTEDARPAFRKQQYEAEVERLERVERQALIALSSVCDGQYRGFNVDAAHGWETAEPGDVVPFSTLNGWVFYVLRAPIDVDVDALDRRDRRPKRRRSVPPAGWGGLVRVVSPDGECLREEDLKRAQKALRDYVPRHGWLRWLGVPMKRRPT